MNADLELRRIERRAWLRTFEHGFWDLAIGLLLLSFGLSILTGLPWLAGAIIPVLLPAFQAVGRRFLAPRIGHATFRKRRQKSVRRVSLVLSALVIAGVGMFAVMAWSTSGSTPSWVGWIRLHSVLVIGLIWGGALAIGAWAVDLPRLYGYGVALFAALVMSDWVRGYHLGYALVSVGGFIAILAAALLARFVLRYPRRPIDPMEGDDASTT